MSNIDFEAMFNTIKTGITNLAATSLKSYATSASADMQNFLASIKTNIQTWTQEFVAGKMDADELQDLVNGETGLLKMEAVTEAGLLQAQADEFKAGVINIIVSAITKVVP